MVRYLYQGQNGKIWIGTNGNRNGGLDNFDGNTFTNFNEENGLCSNNITVIFQSSDGKIWFGGRKGNLWRYDREKLNDLTQLKTNKRQQLTMYIKNTI